MYRIMIVEDDDAISAAVKRQIELWGYDARCVRDFRGVMSEFADYDPHLVLLDIYLPFYNGYYWCTEIRRASSVPVMFISSASDKMNVVMAMNMGGDDFIAKPIDLDVLTVKIQALLRRTYGMAGRSRVMEHRGVVLNLDDATVDNNGARVELTRNEFKILQTLMENRGKVVSRDALMTRLWQIDSYVEENTLTVNVTRLRKKLEGIGLVGFITTRIGSGYIIE